MSHLAFENVSNPKKTYVFFKQSIETMISILVLFTLLPLLMLVMIMIKLDSSGPIFFLQERIGMGGKPFHIIKFRTMSVNAEKYGPQWAKKNDLRITNTGYYLRKYRIDEIPQLINVIRGEMSIIGPRPERQYFINQFEKKIPHFNNRLSVKPGITGLAQICGGYELTPVEKLEYDLYYIQKCSFLLDMKILIQSIPVILFAKGWR